MRSISDLLTADDRRHKRLIYPDKARVEPDRPLCLGDRLRAVARIGVAPRVNTIPAGKVARARERERVMRWIEHNATGRDTSRSIF